MESTGQATTVIALLLLAGVFLGFQLGSCGEGDGETVVQTVEVTQTKTVRRTRTVVRTVTAEPVTSTLGEGCSDDYAGVCVPTDGSSLDCSTLSDTGFEVVGDDVYGLDPDGDGTACEPGE